jgi:hypothetical protein
MTKSIAFTALLVGLAGCARTPAPPPVPADQATALSSAFDPYCGPIWLVAKQGYVYLPCPPGSGYESGLNR